MVDVSLYSSPNVSFCRNISDKHLVLLPLNNIGFDECRVTGLLVLEYLLFFV